MWIRSGPRVVRSVTPERDFTKPRTPSCRTEGKNKQGVNAEVRTSEGNQSPVIRLLQNWTEHRQGVVPQAVGQGPILDHLAGDGP
jgi:hypothetical protein